MTLKKFNNLLLCKDLKFLIIGYSSLHKNSTNKEFFKFISNFPKLDSELNTGFDVNNNPLISIFIKDGLLESNRDIGYIGLRLSKIGREEYNSILQQNFTKYWRFLLEYCKQKISIGFPWVFITFLFSHWNKIVEFLSNNLIWLFK